MKNVKKAVRRAAEVRRKPEVAETEESALGIEQVEDNFRAKRKAIRKVNPNNEQRLFRAIQWAKRGLAVENKVEQVILLWIAFNALYGCKEHLAPPQSDTPAAKPIDNFLERITFRGGGKPSTALQKCQAALRECRSNCEDILDCQYVYHHYWLSAEDGRDWEDSFERDNKRARRALDAGDAKDAMKEIFRRVRVLRNQLLHGGAAFFSNSAYIRRDDLAEAERKREDEFHPFNGTQVRAGAEIMQKMIPTLIDAVIDLHKKDCWGDLSYPPQERPDEKTAKPAPLR